jgi:uncharacterized protein YrzB (UPF0473 family)
MKRNLSCILMVLFILAACAPIPEGLDQSATTTQELIISAPIETPTATAPSLSASPTPLKDCESRKFILEDYPNNPDCFILSDTRTNEQKLEIIKKFAPDDFEKEVNLYRAEWERMDRDVNDLQIIASIVDGKSWTLVPMDKNTGQIYVPKIQEFIQTSFTDLMGI